MQRSPVAASCENKLVIDRNKRMLDLFAPETRQSADTDQDRQKELDREAP